MEGLLTVKNGCFEFWRTLFSVSVCATSSWKEKKATKSVCATLTMATHLGSSHCSTALPLAAFPALYLLIGIHSLLL